MSLCKLHIDQVMAFPFLDLHYTSLKPSHTRGISIVDIVTHLQTRQVYSPHFLPYLKIQLSLDVFLLMIPSQKGKRTSNKTLHCPIDQNLLNRNTLFTETASAVQQGPFLQALQTATMATGQRDRLNQRIVANLTLSMFSIQNLQQVMLADHSSLGDLGRTKLRLKQLTELLQAYRLGYKFCLSCTHSVCMLY